MDNDGRLGADERMVRIPRTGTKVCLLAAALMLIAAIYSALVPIQVQVGNGSWDCGNAFNKPSAQDGGGFCGRANDIKLAQAGAFAAAALVTGVGGYLIFGGETRIETRVRRPADDEF